MCYAIVTGSEKNKLYFTKIERDMCTSCDSDGIGEVVYKIKRIPKKEDGREKGGQIVGYYVPELAMARKFRSREKAEELIKAYPVLRFCRVEEVTV